MEQVLVQMESSPSDPELLHSISVLPHHQGECYFAGVQRSGGVWLMWLRICWMFFREQQALPTADLISLLLEAVDELRSMIAGATAGARELTPAQQELKKEIALEAEKRRRRQLWPGSCSEFGCGGEGGRTSECQSPHAARGFEKLDTMLNLTGEIVIAQGRLRRMIEKLGTEQGSAILEMHARQSGCIWICRAEVMSIRMVPIGPLFRQFIRSVRDMG